MQHIVAVYSIQHIIHDSRAVFTLLFQKRLRGRGFGFFEIPHQVEVVFFHRVVAFEGNLLDEQGGALEIDLVFRVFDDGRGDVGHHLLYVPRVQEKVFRDFAVVVDYAGQLVQRKDHLFCLLNCL